MLRTLVFLAAVGLAVVLIRKLLSTYKPAVKQQRKVASKDMVRCALCGLHVPEHEAVEHKGRRYCSQEHALSDGSTHNKED